MISVYQIKACTLHDSKYTEEYYISKKKRRNLIPYSRISAWFPDSCKWFLCSFQHDSE